MAIIQFKRKTSAGTGPLIGSSGSIKAGEPLIDLNGGNLFISKADKNGTSGNPLALADYIEFYSKANADLSVDSKITALALGTASKKNTGTSNGTIPLIGSDGKLPVSIIPNTSPVTSVNAKTGAVTITLSELGGISSTTYNAHVSSSLHLTDAQRAKILNLYNTYVSSNASASFASSKTSLESASVGNGLLMFYEIDTNYNPYRTIYHFGIDKTKVLTPSSTIDGGTY